MCYESLNKQKVWLFLGVLCVCGLFAPKVTIADSPVIAGTYMLDKEASDDFTEAFEEELQEMGRIRRTIARHMISRRGGHAEQIRIVIEEHQIVFHSDDRDPIIFPADGSEITHINDNGDEMKARAELEGNLLRISMNGEDGGTVTEYQLNSTGDILKVDRKLTSDRLSNPVEFQVVYHRD